MRTPLIGAVAAAAVVAAVVAAQAGSAPRVATAQATTDGFIGYGIRDLVGNDNRVAGVNPDGTGASEGQPGLRPRYAPDGNRELAIAFGDAPQGLVIRDVGGGAERRLRTGGVGWASWSPDGARIAFLEASSLSLEPSSTVVTIWTMRADGAGAARVPLPAGTEAISRGLDWGPAAAGSRIAFVALVNDRPDCVGWQIVTVLPDGSDPTCVATFADDDAQRLAASVKDLAWSPDGTDLAVVSDWPVDGSLWIADVAAGGSRRVAGLGGTENGELRADSVAWSPDGRRLAVGGYVPDGSARVQQTAGAGVFVLSATGGAPRRVTPPLARDSQVFGVDWQPCIAGVTRSCRSSTGSAAGGPAAGSVVSGSVTVQVGGGAAVPLTPGRPLPVGAVVDATAGAVRLAAGPSKSAVFSRGAFRVVANGAVSELALAGGDFSACKKRKTSARGATPTKVIRQLWGDGKGRFRMRGRFAAATVRGTTWRLEDACEGTIVRVQRGSVEVRDIRSGRVRVVRAGASLLVPA